MAGCEQARAGFLDALLADQAVPPSGPVADHLSGCERCRAELADLGRTWLALGQLPEVVPGDEMRIRLLRRVRRELVREWVLTVGGWIPAVLAAALGVGLSLALALLVPYLWLVSVCQQVLRLSDGHAAPYFLAGMAYGMPLAAGASVLRRRAAAGGIVGSLEASLLFLVILAPFVLARCSEFPPSLQAALLSGLAVGAVTSSLAGLALARLIPLRNAHS